MTHRKMRVHFLLTTALCGFLAACGGERNTPDGVYHGENAGDRTARMDTVKQPSASALATRVEKLENDVSVLKNDMSQLAVSYNGLVTHNERIDSVLDKIEQEQASAPVPAVEHADLMPVVKQEKAVKQEPVKALPKEAVVLGVRLGEHPGKTRMVIDWSHLGEVKTDLDNTEKLLIVTLSKTKWDAKTLVSGLSSPLVSGWSVQDEGGVKTLVVQLKKAVKVDNVGKLKPEGGKPARVVIDLSAA